MRTAKFLLLALVLVPWLGACASNWDRYPDSLYAVLREDDAPSIKAHHDLLRKLMGNGEQPHKPGLAAEYAYYCWRLGHQDEARSALALERQHYPQSERFLEVFERFLSSVPAVTITPEGEGP